MGLDNFPKYGPVHSPNKRSLRKFSVVNSRWFIFGKVVTKKAFRCMATLHGKKQSVTPCLLSKVYNTAMLCAIYKLAERLPQTSQYIKSISIFHPNERSWHYLYFLVKDHINSKVLKLKDLP